MLPTDFLSECLTGNEGAIQTLVRSYQRGVFQIALSILDRNQDAEEAAMQAEIATRETFIAALDQLNRYRPETPFNTWLFGIAIRVTLRRAAAWRRERAARNAWNRLWQIFSRTASQPVDQQSARAAGGAVQPGFASGDGTGRSGPAQTRADDPIWKTVCLLNDRLRLPVILRYYHDFSIEQISKILHLSEGVVHARLDMAREKLTEFS